jgi:hypothetical protein
LESAKDARLKILRIMLLELLLAHSAAVVLAGTSLVCGLSAVPAFLSEKPG